MRREYPDGPRLKLPLVILGQILARWFPFDPLAFALDLARRFGDVAHYKLGPLHVYQLNHPELAREVLVDQAGSFRKPKLVKWALGRFAGEGLLTSDGALWKRQRKLIQPAFHQSRLAAYLDVIVAHTRRMADSFQNGEIRDIGAEMSKLTLAIVVQSLFGEDLAQQANEISRLVPPVLDAANYRLNSVLRIPPWIPTRRNLRESRAVSELDALLSELVRIRRTSAQTRDDLLAVLLAAVDEASAAGMTDQQLRDEMMTLLLAGHETTANALTWTWYLLSRHPDVAANLVDELDCVLADREPSLSDLPKLLYTEMAIREAIRLYPPAPGIAREAIEEVIIGRYHVPKGSVAVVSTYALQRDKRFFPDPERYDPDRFRPGWEERIPRYAYLPFGAGPRVCIGGGFAMMEARLIVAILAQHWKLSLTHDEAITPVQMVTLRPSHPVRMRLERRK